MPHLDIPQMEHSFRYITGDDANQIQLFYRNSNTATVGLTIKETDLDRSVNNKGLEVHGTITKSAVATGADLVAYSGLVLHKLPITTL